MQGVTAGIFLLSEALGFFNIKSYDSVGKDWRRKYSPTDDHT